MQGLNELTQQMLVRFTQLDYSRELALIAVLENHEQETELEQWLDVSLWGVKKIKP